MKDLTQLKTAELVTIYNRLTNKSITKFADRKTAEAQTAKAIKNTGACPCCFASNKAVKLVNDERQEFKCKECGKHFIGENEVEAQTVTPEDRKANHSAGVKTSWANPDIAAKRAERHGVKVDGQEYGSVLKAFIALGLPVNKHIKFRGELKAEGQKAFEQEGKTFNFEVFAKEHVAKATDEEKAAKKAEREAAKAAKEQAKAEAKAAREAAKAEKAEAAAKAKAEKEANKAAE